MRVLFVSSEVFPLVKTGGLADVSGALPAALAAAGHDVRILMPAYPDAMRQAAEIGQPAGLGDPLQGGAPARLIPARMPDSGVFLWLVDCPALFDRAGGPYQDQDGADWPDNALRFGLLSWAAAHLGAGGAADGWRPDVVHLNDWQSGLAAAYLRAWGVPDAPKTVFTIHNMAYQGQFPPEMVPRLGLPWDMYQMEGFEYYNTLSFMKAGLFYADALTTVSPRYAREIQDTSHGCGMEGLLARRRGALSGILNGADYGVWDPESDPHLVQPYRPGDGAGKAANKAALQAELGLAVAPQVPLLVIVSRLNEQKGMDMVLARLPTLLKEGAQLALLGTGDKPLEAGFAAASAANPAQVAARIGYSEPLAHRLLAGGDILLMPSRFEPCGLTQIYALRYGTVPLVHATGGLADTVTDTTYDSLMTGTATGFSFEHASAGPFQWCLERALGLYAQPEQWARIQAAGVRAHFGWEQAAGRYGALYDALVKTP